VALCSTILSNGPKHITQFVSELYAAEAGTRSLLKGAGGAKRWLTNSAWARDTFNVYRPNPKERPLSWNVRLRKGAVSIGESAGPKTYQVKAAAATDAAAMLAAVSPQPKSSASNLLAAQSSRLGPAVTTAREIPCRAGLASMVDSALLDADLDAFLSLASAPPHAAALAAAPPPLGTGHADAPQLPSQAAADGCTRPPRARLVQTPRAASCRVKRFQLNSSELTPLSSDSSALSFSSDDEAEPHPVPTSMDLYEPFHVDTLEPCLSPLQLAAGPAAVVTSTAMPAAAPEATRRRVKQYRCDFHCGFTGAFQLVAEHEATCAKRLGASS
jgi:hypothetical protein